MQIYHCQSKTTERWAMDPTQGMVMRREEVIQPSGAHAIVVPAGQFESTPEGAEFAADGGTFDVPDDVATFFLRMPGWASGPSPFEVEAPPAKAKAKAAG